MSRATALVPPLRLDPHLPPAMPSSLPECRLLYASSLIYRWDAAAVPIELAGLLVA